MSLERLLRPRSVAVIGGGTWCANVIEQLHKIGFDGPVWPVHPTRQQVGGLPAFTAIADLPGAPDASFIGVNRATTIEVLRALSARGAGGAVCFASGYRESAAETGDGGALQQALLQAAGDMAILGPNCYGFVNALDRAALWPDQHGCVPVERGVALITQSSNIAINLTMQRRSVPLAYVVTAGNQAQTDLARIGRTLLADDRVTALGLHIEGIADLPAFEALAGEARARGKRIVALKIGASQAAQAATVSHTASLAGSDAGARALFDRLGVARVDTLAALLETLKLLHVAGPLASRRIASLSCSGGEASLMADSLLGCDLEFPPLNETQRQSLRAALGPKVALANPLDYHTYIWGDRAAMTACYAAMLDPALALGVIVVDFPRADRCDPSAWDVVIDAAADAQRQCGVPVALLASLPETMPEDIAGRIMAAGLIPLCGLTEGLAAIEAAAWLGRDWTTPAPVLPSGPLEATRLLTEAEAKAALADYGLAVPRGGAAHSPEAARALAAAIGAPVALKGQGAAHKTEAGLVALNLATPDAVAAAAQSMPAQAFLVEEMIPGPAVELIVGILRDPAHGFVLTLGAGGTLTELLGDSASLLLPATGAEIAAALDRLRIAPLLAGWRGAPPTDRAAILHAVTAAQAYALDHAADLVELEVNPLLCTPDRAVAVDALIRLGDPE
ncbi:acetate--CoA ligase family protein [Thalassococcus sp. CAU 1522]|uniref:Acetate--CoA ligase family protein n=1 Tax=Thalassococcus arenae TaxID=2851652 RepID=A0ABS6NAS6_9RHOB|nr:acetate--CoA ligase family protein [Thalassococcus arenae]MBV2360630.1 acetate--CoA ligase family protein [Thalassococcus arenae]